LFVPFSKFVSVHFETVRGLKVFEGNVQLVEPLVLENNVLGGEILVVGSKASNMSRTVYQPTTAVGNLHSPFRQSVYYNPRFATKAELKFSTTLFLPKNASQSAQIFSVAVHDTGDKYPLVDIFPEIQLRVPASIATQELEPAPSESARTRASAQGKIRSFQKTGTLRFDGKQSFSSQTQIVETTLNSSDACAAWISSISSQISAALSTTGSVYLKGCESLAPFVHIVVSNNSDSRTSMRSVYSLTGEPSSRLQLSLIESWASGSQVTLNGFTWAGDPGYGTGKGYALGFVQQDTNCIGNNASGGGCSSTEPKDSNKLVFRIWPGRLAEWRESINSPIWTDGDTNGVTIGSSSTSVVKGGLCSGDSLSNRWSAFGTTPDGRMVFASSISDGSTTAAELCPVFKALGANNAIRLDGSTATGITIDGARRNPIIGSFSFLVGPSRYIGHALRVGYRSGAMPGGTPSIDLDGTVQTPRNPCIRNPRLCQ
jgi:Phosphodiester glycosidase